MTDGKQLIKVYPKQAEMIRSMCNFQRVITLAARQCGKCVQGKTKIKIRNKKTGKINQIGIEEFFNLMKKNKQ